MAPFIYKIFRAMSKYPKISIKNIWSALAKLLYNLLSLHFHIDLYPRKESLQINWDSIDQN